MIKTKKFIAVLLCLMLGIQSFAVLAESPAQNTQDYSIYPEIAVKLGILDASIMGRLNKNITRGELVAAIVHMRGLAGDAKSIFSDVAAEHPYAKEISCAYQSGYINGFGDGTFRPDEEATYAQLLKLLVYLAGYSELVESGLSVESVATKAKITKHINLSAAPSIKVGEAAQILVDVGSEVEALDISGFVDGGSKYSSNGQTIFNAYLDVYKKDAIISANANTGIYEQLDLGENMIMLGTQKMKDSTDNASKLIGCNVTAYVREPRDGKPELLYAHLNNENKITKIPALKLDDFKDGILYYVDENDEDEEVAIKLSSVAVIYNGVLTMVPSADDFKIETGSIELISNDGDKDIDVVKIEKYDNYIVDTYDKNSNILWFKFGDGMLNFEELDNVELTSSNNKALDLREVGEWDVVSVCQSKNNELVKVVYITGEVEGKVTAKYNKKDKMFEIDGVAYHVADVFMNNLYDEIYVGQSASFYFDIEGKIASYNLLGYSEKKFYYLAGIVSDGGMEIEAKAKLMDELGNISILPLASKVELDTVKKALKNSQELKELVALKPQIIIGKLNSSGELSYIDTKEDGGSLKVLNPSTEMQYKKNTMVFYKGTSQVSVSSKTIYMYVPQPGKKAQDDDYYIQKISGLSNNTKFAFTAYTDGDGIIADAIVRTHNPESGVSFAQDHAPAIVNEISKAINTNGDPSYKVSVYNTSGNLNTYYTEDENTFDGLTLEGKSYFPAKGDIVRVSTNRYGQIRGIQPVYCAVSGDIAGGSNPNTADILSVYRIQIAYAYSKDDHFVKTTTTKPLPEHLHTDAGLENLELKNLSVYKVCVYDSEKDLITVGNDLSVRDFISTNGLEASKMFIFERYLETGMVCIYR